MFPHRDLSQFTMAYANSHHPGIVKLRRSEQTDQMKTNVTADIDFPMKLSAMLFGSTTDSA
jgi:hypothetical protein